MWLYSCPPPTQVHYSHWIAPIMAAADALVFFLWHQVNRSKPVRFRHLELVRATLQS